MNKQTKNNAFAIALSTALLGFSFAPALVLADALVERALALDSRTAKDVARDQRSHPAEVLSLLQLQVGDNVADIFGGGGYYSEILSNIVGPEGKVYLHNNAPYLKFVGSALTDRLARFKASQLLDHRAEADDLRLPEDSLDAAMIVMSYHDIYHTDVSNGWTLIDGKDFLGQIHRGLKVGGRFLIVDHEAKLGTGKSMAQNLHRIESSFAIADIESHGFKLSAQSDILRNPDDDLSVMVFDPAIRGKTDRFILVFEKVAAPKAPSLNLGQ